MTEFLGKLNLPAKDVKKVVKKLKAAKGAGKGVLLCRLVRCWRLAALQPPVAVRCLPEVPCLILGLLCAGTL